MLRVLWLAAYTAAVPGLVGRGQVPRANAIFEAVFNIGWIVGPALAGLLAGAIGPGPTIAIDALTFLVSAVSLLFIRRPLRPERRAEQTHILADIREGVAFVARQATLRSVIALWTAIQVISAGLTTALIFYVTQDRGLGTAVVGIVLSAFALGALGGSLLAARMAPRAVGPVMLGGAVGFGLTLVISVGAPVPLMVAMALLAGILNANVLVAYVSLRTMLSPDALLGRVGATARTLSVGHDARRLAGRRHPARHHRRRADPRAHGPGPGGAPGPGSPCCRTCAAPGSPGPERDPAVAWTMPGIR